ncbi:MAG: penicillin acylase family protein [Bryobacterales bacterium]|nr:penicillin acylase family protein [Bryobacterales bacterium]
MSRSKLFERSLKYINFLILAFLLTVLGLIGWYGWRTLPTVSGSVEAPISAAGKIVRDSLGTPHIIAASLGDAMFLQGYATAQDRLWQMDAIRRSTAGELAEIAGKVALPLDIRARRIGFARTARVQEAHLRPEDRALFAAYARGVNYFIDTHRDKLPPEFAILRYEPRPWTITDSILVGLRMAADLTTTWEMDLDKERMARELAATFPEMDEAQLRTLVNGLFPVRSGNEVLAGSNAWVLSGAHTESGKPLLANDTHLGVSFPSVWTMVHLKAPMAEGPPLDVAGLTLPGMPAVIIGHNRRIAWGVTSLGADVQDLYEERMDLNAGVYQFGAEVRQANRIIEGIRVKGEPDVRLNVFVTQHGPLIAQAGEPPYNRNLSLQWTALDPDFLSFPFLELGLAQDWTAFRKALSRFNGPGQNFVYADIDGNIGFQVAARLPRRTHAPGDMPLPGYTGLHEWQGYVPFEELPSLYNPPSGRIVTANQNPFPPDFPDAGSGRFSSPHRAHQIRARLDAKPKWNAAGMLEIQKDVYSPYYAFLARQVVAAADRKKPAPGLVADAIEVLRNWNGQAELDAAGATIARLYAIGLRAAILKRLAPKWEQAGMGMDDTVVERILRTRDPLYAKDFDAWLLEVLGKALEDNRPRMGGALANWKYRELMHWDVDHPVFSRLPLIGRYFNIGRVPMSGSPSSPKQVGPASGPSQRFVADLSNWDASFANVLAGVSGHPLSSHYKDQWKPFYYGTSFPLPFEKLEAEEILEFRPSK